MIKNMTRKGLAIGAGLALVASGLALPAYAGVANGSVSLVPAAGDEYDILAGSEFDLKANFTSAVQGTGKNLKFLIEDPAGSTNVVTSVGTSVYNVASAASGNTIEITNGSSTDPDVLTLTLDGDSHRFKVGDRVRLTGAAAAYTVATAGGTPAGGYNLLGVHTISAIGTTTVSIEFPGASGTGVTATTGVFNVALEPSVATPYSVANTTAAATHAAASSPLPATLTVTTAAAHQFKVGDTVRIAGTGVATVDGDRLILAVASGTTFAFETTASADTVALTAGTVTLVRAAYTKYIYDTKRDSNAGADSVLRLKSTDNDSTQTITVTAWIDDNDNGLIDPTEYVSATRTVRFLAHSAVTPTVTLDPIYVGQSTVTAKVTTSPALNGAQLVASNNRNGAANALRVAFTRPGSANALWARTADMTYSNLTKVWTAVSPNMNATSGETAPAGGFTQWGIAQAVNRTLTSVSITSNVVTATVNDAHGLQVGDRVVITGATLTEGPAALARVNSPTSGTAGLYSVITAVPTTTTFRYAEQNANGTAATGADLVESAMNAGAVNATTGAARQLRNFTVPGTYTATAYLHKGSTTNALTTTGVIAQQVVGVNVADSVELTGVPSANVNVDGAVRKGTTTASFVATVSDDDNEPVGAGVKVAVKAAKTLGTAGVIKVNGVTVGTTQVTIPATTDASGQVAITVENSLGNVGDRVNLEVDAEGKTDTLSAIWADAVFSIVDLNDVSDPAAPARNRAADASGNYTFDLIAIDQFKQVAPATVRLLATVTGRTTMTTPVALTNGRATVTISPDGSAVTGPTTVDMKFQILNALNQWVNAETVASADPLYTDWAAGEAGTVAINFYSQTDRVTLNANGANFPSSVTAVRTANVTTNALKAVDLRTVNDVAASYADSTQAIVSGRVANSVSGVAKSGGLVTVSGAGMLFNVLDASGEYGPVWAQNSVTLIANDGDFAVAVYSRVAGKQTVTVASGAVTSTAELTFNAVGTITGYSVNLVAPASAAPGTTFKVEGQVRDVNGNPVVIATAGTGANPTLTVTYNGPGLVSGQLPTTTNATGTFSFFVLLGSNDRGVATVTATYDADGTGTASAAVSTTATINIGTVAGTVRGWTKDMGDGTVKLYARDLVAQGKVQFFHNGTEVAWIRAVDATDPKLNVASDGMVRTRALVSGRNVFEIYVDGERIVRRIATGS